MGHLVGGKDHANLQRGFHKNEGRNNNRIETKKDTRSFASADLGIQKAERPQLG
jgi:hypothetical protein